MSKRIFHVSLVFLCCVAGMACSQGYQRRGAAGVQQAPDRGPLAPAEPMWSPASGAPEPVHSPADGVHRPAEPFSSPVSVFPVMSFAPQRRNARSAAPSDPSPAQPDPPPPGQQDPTADPTSVPTQPTRQGPEDLIEPQYGQPVGEQPATYPPDRRTRDEVRAGMEALRARIEGCFEGGFPGGVLSVEVVVTPDGVVDQAFLPESLPRDQSMCVEDVLIQGQLRQIEGQPLRVVYPYADDPADQ